MMAIGLDLARGEKSVAPPPPPLVSIERDVAWSLLRTRAADGKSTFSSPQLCGVGGKPLLVGDIAIALKEWES
jgi:hypothetical protein